MMANTSHQITLVLAIGHSARDTFQMLYDKGVYIEAKPFSIGFRIEHPQSVIDKARFGPNAEMRILGAADYKLVHHAKNGRSVYSFCMCPGGTVVAATSEPGRVVTNGMSQYSRNERNANSAIVVGISRKITGILLQVLICSANSKNALTKWAAKITMHQDSLSAISLKGSNQQNWAM
jgi:uncharacterized FAD-dependent dehydrogenase